MMFRYSYEIKCRPYTLEHKKYRDTAMEKNKVMQQ